MPKFVVQLEVRKVYSIEVEAADTGEARNKAEDMQTLDVYDQGSLTDISTLALNVEEW